MENIENKEIMEEVETSEMAEVGSENERNTCDVAVGTAIIGGLSVLAWEFAIKPLGKKAIGAGKNVYQKLKAKKSKKIVLLDDSPVEETEE